MLIVSYKYLDFHGVEEISFNTWLKDFFLCVCVVRVGEYESGECDCVCVRCMHLSM